MTTELCTSLADPKVGQLVKYISPYREGSWVYVRPIERVTPTTFLVFGKRFDRTAENHAYAKGHSGRWAGRASVQILKGPVEVAKISEDNERRVLAYHAVSFRGWAKLPLQALREIAEAIKNSETKKEGSL